MAIIASQSKACCLIVGMGNISTACCLFDLVLHVHFPPNGLDINIAALRTALCRFCSKTLFPESLEYLSNVVTMLLPSVAVYHQIM